MPFFDSGLNQVLEAQLADFKLLLSNPRCTPSGGALLTRVSSDRREPLGIVLIGPNISRPFQTGFNPASEHDRYENDFMNRLVFVSQADYEASEINKNIVDVISLGATFLGRMMDDDSSCGCMVSSYGTPVYQLRIGDTLSFVQLPDLYVVVTAKFVDSAADGAAGPMTVTEYWIATHADRDLILGTDEYTAARARSRTNMPADCPSRRDRVLAQIDRLRRATPDQIFERRP